MDTGAFSYGFRHDPMPWIQNDESLDAARLRVQVFRIPNDGDEALIDAEIGELFTNQGDNGSFEEDLGHTACQVRKALELGCPPDAPKVQQAVRWLLEHLETKPIAPEEGLGIAAAVCMTGHVNAENIQSILGWYREADRGMLVDRIAGNCPWSLTERFRELWDCRSAARMDAPLQVMIDTFLDGVTGAGTMCFVDTRGLLPVFGHPDCPHGCEIIRRMTPRFLRSQKPDGSLPFDIWRALMNHGLVDPLLAASPLPHDWRVVRAMGRLITFSKAKMTAELIYRYACENLRQTKPAAVSKVAAYRGGYRPEERREIEERLFSGDLVGVSTTPAMELGIDVGSLEGCLIVGYPGTRTSFFQQAGRAGRKYSESLVFLIGLDTSVNQYIMHHPEYLFDTPVEHTVINPENPYIALGHIRCAAYELALSEEEIGSFGPHAALVLEILEENRKVKHIAGRWYHCATETPHHEVSLRGYSDANVVIEDMDTGNILGEVNRFEAEPILHPEAIYMHHGDTYRVHELDLDRNIARVGREAVDYYTQPLGGTDIHHIDHQLREKPFGTGTVYWGEVTAYFNTYGFEKVQFYSLDAISAHEIDLPTMVLETMALWIVPPEELMEKVRQAGLDAHSGLRGIGYATRMLLPMFITCQTLDFSHTVGSANSPWNAIFIYERHPHGLGFTEQAYAQVSQIMPVVLDNIRRCPCADGCPCCVGKPLRQFTTWNVERGEASIPSKAGALVILEGLLPDTDMPVDVDSGNPEHSLRRRLERMREPQVFHDITPRPTVKTGYPEAEKPEELPKPDVTRRKERRREFEKGLHRRIADRITPGNQPVDAGESEPNRPGAPCLGEEQTDKAQEPPLTSGDALAARARKLVKRKTGDN